MPDIISKAISSLHMVSGTFFVEPDNLSDYIISSETLPFVILQILLWNIFRQLEYYDIERMIKESAPKVLRYIERR